MAGHPRRIPPIGLSMLGASPSAQLAASALRSEALKDRQKSISASSALPWPVGASFPDISAGRDIGFSIVFSHLSFDHHRSNTPCSRLIPPVCSHRSGLRPASFRRRRSRALLANRDTPGGPPRQGAAPSRALFPAGSHRGEPPG